MQIRLARDLEGQGQVALAPMTVDAFLTHFPEAPRDLPEEPVMAEFVPAFGAQLDVAKKPSLYVVRAVAAGAEHDSYARLISDLALYNFEPIHDFVSPEARHR